MNTTHKEASPPEKYVHESASYQTSSRSSSYESGVPGSIPNLRDPVPPPLPPPKYLSDVKSNDKNDPDLTWRFANSHTGPSVAPGHGSSTQTKVVIQDSPDHSRNASSPTKMTLNDSKPELGTSMTAGNPPRGEEIKERDVRQATRRKSTKKIGRST